MPIESYVVRIYRRPSDQQHGLVGLVEAEGLGEKRAFATVEELWEILAKGPLEKHERSMCKPTPDEGASHPVAVRPSTNEGETQ